MEIDPSSLFGRIAQLVDLKVKPELNESFVEISSYDTTNSRYAVRTLSSPALGTPPISAFVKLANLKLLPSFLNLYPAAQVVCASSFSSDMVDDVVVIDISSGDVAGMMSDNEPKIRKSCCIRGPRQHGLSPTVRFYVTVVVDCVEPDSFVEFQDINFAGSEARGFGVCCAGAGNVVFRRCTFSHKKSSCAVGSATGSVNVVFENCIFEGFEKTGLFISLGSHATLLNCVVRGGLIGVRVEDAGSAVLKHCIISETAQTGAYIYLKGNLLEMMNCTVGPSRSTALNINKCGTVLVRGCLFTDCGSEAIGLNGARNTTFENCIIRNCSSGLLMTTGDNALTMNKCHLQNVQKYGIGIGRGATGSVDITCDPSDHMCHRINQDAGPKCLVTLDGRVLPHVEHSGINDKESYKQLQEKMRRDGSAEGNLRFIELMKAHKKAGTGHIQCFNCDTIEPEDVKYKRCSRCEAACYCSKECQAEHWKAHKADCKERGKR